MFIFDYIVQKKEKNRAEIGLETSAEKQFIA